MFNAIQIGIITNAINLAIAKVARTNRFMTPADRADLFQSAFLKIMEGYSPLRTMLADAVSDAVSTKPDGATFAYSNLGAFAYRCGFNVAIDFLRSRKGSRLDSRFTSLDAPMGEEKESLGAILPDHTPNPRDLLIMKRKQEAVNVALASLSEAERAAMITEEDRPATVAERVRKMRAMDKIQESVIAA